MGLCLGIVRGSRVAIVTLGVEMTRGDDQDKAVYLHEHYQVWLLVKAFINLQNLQSLETVHLRCLNFNHLLPCSSSNK